MLNCESVSFLKGVIDDKFFVCGIIIVHNTLFFTGLIWRRHCAAILLAGTFLAQSGITQADEGPAQIRLTQNPDAGFYLVANQAPVAVILDKIARTTHILIHYSLLPDAPVTATCNAATVSGLLKCLLGSQVDRVYRYPQPTDLNAANALSASAQPEEVWLLATNMPVKPGISQNVSTPAKDFVAPVQSPEERALIEETLKQAASANTGERAGALHNLGLIGNKDDADILKTLKEAMTDKNANIRMQAITSLMQREGENAALEVQQALKDDDVNVRMAVLSNVHNDTAILQQALSDSDKTIRDLAASKLSDLAYRQNK
jgi:hypothetical protein